MNVFNAEDHLSMVKSLYFYLFIFFFFHFFIFFYFVTVLVLDAKKIFVFVLIQFLVITELRCLQTFQPIFFLVSLTVLSNGRHQ